MVRVHPWSGLKNGIVRVNDSLRGPERRAPARDALARNEGGLGDVVEGMGDQTDAAGDQLGAQFGVRKPVGEEVDFGGAGRLGEALEHVGQGAFAARQERPDDLRFEAGAVPSGRHDDDAREFGAVRGFKVDQRSPDVPGQEGVGLGVKGSPRDRGLRTGRENRAGTD
jgi:hypothetical protein